MKAIEWERYFARQQREHGKTVFTAAELANVANTTPAAVNVMLARLIRNRVLERVARGLYAVPGAASVDEVLPLIDPGAYITGARVLFDEGLITQFPTRTQCFTRQRHFRSIRETKVGKLAFQVVRPPIYSPPTMGVRSSPEQALLDLAWSAGETADLRTLYTFRNLKKLKPHVLDRLASRYPAGTRELVEKLLRDECLNKD